MIKYYEINFYNTRRILGLDMVVRDEQGNILNPESTSIIELFRHHENATQRISAPSVSFSFYFLDIEMYE